jgi:uncharacterized membrane protein
MRSTIRRFLSTTSGNIAVMTALTMPVGIVLGAVAIDSASLYTERREAQSLVDLAAITAAANLSKAQTAVLTTFRENGVTDVTVAAAGAPLPSDASGIKPTVTITPGRYVGNASAAVATRFQAGATPHNAVKVTYSKTGTRFFGTALIDPPTISTQAIAGAKTEAAFSVGSRLASLNEGIVNSLLSGLLGGNVSLDIMDYNALLSADVSAFSFLDALATNLNIKAGTYSDVLDSTVKVGQIVSAMAAIPGQDNAVKVALNKLLVGIPAKVTVPLKAVFDIGSAAHLGLGQRPAGLSADVNALQMLMASVVMADGKNQAGVNLKIDLLGLAGASLEIAVGEPPQKSPWYTIGEAGAVVRTAQTRIKLNVDVAGNLEPLLGKLINIPIYAEVAYAEARLTEITCPTGPSSRQVKVAVTPGLADLRIADIKSAAMKDFTRKPNGDQAKLVNVQLLGLGLAGVMAHAQVRVGNQNPQTLTFNNQEITDQVVKSASTRDVTTSLVSSLLGELSLKAQLLFITLDLPKGTLDPLMKILQGVTPAVDTLLYNVLALLGVKVGEADVKVHGATCARSVLVQ